MVKEITIGKWIKNYWICNTCAEAHGGTKSTVQSSGKMGKCTYCNEENKIIIPYHDFDYPNDIALNRHCQLNRSPE